MDKKSRKGELEGQDKRKDGEKEEGRDGEEKL